MATGGEETVTVIYRRIKPGHELEYANWFGRIAEAMKKMPGFKGISVLVPSDSSVRIILYRFADIPSLQAWEDSPQRKEFVDEVAEYATQTYDEASGLETWFHLPSPPKAAKKE